MKKYIILLHIALFVTVNTFCQRIISLQNAIDTALKNNYDIQIAKNSLEISKTNNTFGNAGGLPYVNGAVGEIYSNNITKQRLSGETETTAGPIGENALNASLSAGIVLFNGFKVIATKERLNLLQQQSEILLNQEIQNILADVMLKYYDIIRQESYLKIMENSLDVSSKKLEILNNKANVGMANGVELLQAQTDVNTAVQNLRLQKSVIEQSKADLLLLMNVKNYFSYSIDNIIQIDSTLKLQEILNAIDLNPSYKLSEKQIKIDEQRIREVASQRYPALKLTGNYTFVGSDYNSGSTLMYRNYGPNAGLSLQIPIFNGNVYKNQQQVAKLNLNNSNLQKESIKSSLTTEAIKLYESYSTTLQQLQSEEENYVLTGKLVDLVMQNFRVSQATILDVKAAQTSFENSGYFLTNLKYTAKVAEIELKQLTYSLTGK